MGIIQQDMEPSVETRRGHLYVAFGDQYDQTAAHSVRELRKYSNLPVQVITNLKKKHRHHVWGESDGVIFTEVNLRDDENRHPKCQPDLYSIFDETLYTDADTVCVSSKFVKAFDILQLCDIALVVCSVHDSDRRLRGARLYKQAIMDFHPPHVSRVFQAGVVSFKKNKRTRAFFKLWYEYWSKRKLRDMPPLVCAVANSPKLIYATLSSKEFSFMHSTIIRHWSGKNKPSSDELPQYTKMLVNENLSVSRMGWEPRKAFKT